MRYKEKILKRKKRRVYLFMMAISRLRRMRAMAYKENNQAKIKKKNRDAAANKHHDLEEHDGVGIVRHVALVVPCIKLVYPSFRYPIHGLKKTTITHTPNKTKNAP